MKELKPGVNVHVLPTTKFKTISIQCRFRAPLEADQITKRTLVANLMDVNSKSYSTQIKFRKKLSELYGTSYYTDVSRYGNYHVLSFNVDFIDETVIQETGIFEEVIQFLSQAIFSPNVIDGAFHAATFKREVEKLKDDYLSRSDDKAVYADDRLNELYFESPEHQMLSYGQISDLGKATPASVYACYLQMLQEDQIDIFIVGNVTEIEVDKVIDTLDFSPRSPKIRAPFYRNALKSDFKQQIEKQDINQTILSMGFSTPVYYHETYYYSGLIFNGLFGGMTHSKLFQTVREEENMAYAISSDIDAYRGLLNVEAGIERKDIEKTEAIVLHQLKEIQDGLFTDRELYLTKELLKSELLQIADSPLSMIESDYSLSLIDQNKLSVDEWIKKIDNVNRSDVAQLARLIDLKAIFKLIGENS